MKINPDETRKLLGEFDFKTLFREQLGWDNHRAALRVELDGAALELEAIAEKRGFVAYLCPQIPDRGARLKIDRKVAQASHEHLITYHDKKAQKQILQWVRREPGKPLAAREHAFDTAQSGDALIQRPEQLAVPAGASGAAVCLLSSSFYYWLWVALSDCYHVTRLDVGYAPDPALLQGDGALGKLAERLLVDLDTNSANRDRARADGRTQREVNYRVRLSKPVIDEIDRTLATRHGLTAEELDFVINYDIKSRMGSGADEGGDE